MRWPGRLLLLLALLLAGAVGAEVAVPALTTRVTDLTATLTAEQKTGLEGELRAIEQRNGAQLAVFLVPSTQPESIEQYSLRVVEAWKLGRQGKDDGVLLLIAKSDRKLRIEVGYGLEGTIPDAQAKRIIDDTITPRFKQGDFAGGITAGVQRLAELIDGKVAGSAAPDTPPATAEKPREDSLAAPLMLGQVRDLTGTLDEDLIWRKGRQLDDFYNSGRTKPVYVLIVPSTGGEPLAQYAERVLRGWGDSDNLDVDRSLLLVMASDTRQAYLAAGEGLRLRMAPGAAESLSAETLAPLLQKGDLAGALEAAVTGLEKIVDFAVNNKTFEERLFENLSEWPLWLLIGLALIGTAVRWLLGPFFGALTMAGVVGTGTWYVSGAVELGIFAAIGAFVFFVVGLANWLAMGVSSAVGGGGSSSGGGFSGGGGSFGGGGASGSW